MLQINPNRLVIIKTDERESQIGKVKKQTTAMSFKEDISQV